MSDKPRTPTDRPFHLAEGPLDSAQRSLADALRTSFRILKFAMIVLVFSYFASGMFTVEQNKQALVLRFGQVVGDVRNPGVQWAFPPPIDQVIEIPVRQANTLTIESHWLNLSDDEKNIPFAKVTRGPNRGLHPVRDGALLTGDRGLVHIKWRVTYRIEDLKKYVANVSDEDYTVVRSSNVEAIITKSLERAAIDVVGGYTTEDATRKRLNELREELKRRVNGELEALGTGIRVETIEIPMSTPPLQTKLAFDQVIRAENQKKTSIREAEQRATDTLNRAAGAAHAKLIEQLDNHVQAVRSGNDAEARQLVVEINRILEFEASGTAGSMIRAAKGYFTSVVQGMRADAEQYHTLVDEWRDRKDLLVTRTWQEAKQRVLAVPGITKMYRPPGAEFRIRIGPDPRQRELRERREYLGETHSADLSQLDPSAPVEHKFPEGPIE